MHSYFNYRDYTSEELIKLLTQNNTYFSRRNSYGLDQLFPSSTIKVQKTDNRSAGAFKAALVVEAKCCNNRENVIAQLQQNGYELVLGSWAKKWYISSPMTYRPLTLLQQVFNYLETANASMPFQLYESNQYKLIFDYYQFLKSPIHKITYRQLMEYLGYLSDEDKGRIKFVGENSLYIIARYKEGNWAAWIEGDTIIPVFPTEQQAIDFLKHRTALLDTPVNMVPRKIQTGVKRDKTSVYMLVETNKSIKERIEWLYEELSFLEAPRETRGSVL